MCSILFFNQRCKALWVSKSAKCWTSSKLYRVLPCVGVLFYANTDRATKCMQMKVCGHHQYFEPTCILPWKEGWLFLKGTLCVMHLLSVFAWCSQGFVQTTTLTLMVAAAFYLALALLVIAILVSPLICQFVKMSPAIKIAIFVQLSTAQLAIARQCSPGVQHSEGRLLCTLPSVHPPHWQRLQRGPQAAPMGQSEYCFGNFY